MRVQTASAPDVVYYLHSDHPSLCSGQALGSTSLVTCGSTGGCKGTPYQGVVAQQLYLPYGAPRWITGTLPTDFTYTGQRADATGLMFFKAWYYAAGLGRFLSADTVVPSPGNPQDLNRYSYSRNNPLRYVDPTGHDPLPWWRVLLNKALGTYDAARDMGRALLGVDDRIDQSMPNVPLTDVKIPFTNPAEAAALSLMGEDKAYLGGDAIGLIRDDPAMKAYEQSVVDTVRSDPRYMNESFDIANPAKVVAFGGTRNPTPMWEQAKAPWKAKFRDTWKVGGNELTWLLRSAAVTASAQVSEGGSFTINYHLEDKLDLRPNRPTGDPYNSITGLLGFLYHDVARGKEMDIEANWTSTYP